MTATTTPTNTAKPVRPLRTVVENRQARHLYELGATFEAGIKLTGWEVKAILAGQASFNGGGSYVKLRDGDAFLEAFTITPLTQAAKGLLTDLTPVRPRLLLLNKSELAKLRKASAERGLTIVPLEMTYQRHLKVRIAVAKGKTHADKRETIKQRDGAREMARQLRDM